MTTKEVIFAFKRKSVGNGYTLSSTGDKLFSYNTCIAQYIDDYLILNITKYSMTTSKHQNMVKNAFEQYGIDIRYVSDVPKASYDLLKYLKRTEENDSEW